MKPPKAPHPKSNNYSNQTKKDSVVVRNKQRILEANRKFKDFLKCTFELVNFFKLST